MMTALFMFGSTNVNAESKPYWEKYFEENWSEGLGAGMGCGGSTSGLREWKDIDRTFFLIFGGCGDAPDPFTYYPIYYTDNVIFNDVEEVTVKSSDESIMTGEVKPYDFSKEKKALNDFIEYYDKLTFEEFKQELIDYGYEEQAKLYTKKPTWYEYNGWESEPTWWAFYGFRSEPTKAVEVITHAKDLGNATLTVSAKDKEDIHINWKMEIEYAEPDGIIQVLNNLERYKDIIYGGTDSLAEKEYAFRVDYDENDDLSELINTLKGKDVKLLFSNYSSVGETSYILDGNEIKNTVDKGFTYSNEISMETSINKDAIDSLVELKDAIYIDFAYHGTLPTTYKLNVDINQYIYNLFYDQLNCPNYDWEKTEEENAEYFRCSNGASEKANEYLKTTKFDLLYYNPETEKMEVVKQGLLANEEGIVALEFDHFSSYVLVDSAKYNITNNPIKKPNNDAPNNAQTSSMNIILYASILLISLIGIGYLLIKKSKKKIA